MVSVALVLAVATSQGLQHNPIRRPVRAHDIAAISDKVDADCTVVFDADGAFCLEDAQVAMSRADAEACAQTDECEIPDKFKPLLERIVQKKKKPRHLRGGKLARLFEDKNCKRTVFCTVPGKATAT